MLKKILIISFIVLSIPPGFGQPVEHTIDSLLTLIDKANKKDKAALLNQVSKLSVTNSPEKSIQFAEQAYALAEKSGNLHDQATALFNIGSAHYSLSHFNDSKDLFNNALTLFIKLKEIEDIAKAYNNLGLVSRELVEYDQSEQYIRDALNLYKSIDNRDGEAQSMNNLGSLFLRKKDYHKALSWYDEALDIWLKLDDTLKLASLYNNIALVYKEQDKHTQALDYHEIALNLLVNLQDKRELAATYNYIGNIYFKTGIYNKALDAYFNALTIRKKLGNKMEISGSLSNMGLVYLEMNNLKMAEDFFLQAMELYDAAGNTRMLSVTYNRIGNVYLKSGKVKECLAYFENALQLSIELKDDLARSNALKSIGNIYAQQGNFEKALAFFNDALQVNNEIGNMTGNTFLLNDIGNLYLENKQYESALENFENAIKASISVDNNFINALCNRKIGDIYIKLNKPAHAFPYIQKSLDISTQLKHYTLIQNAYLSLYEYYNQTSNINEALNNYILFSNYKDSIHQELNNKQITELQIRSEVEERDDLIGMQEEAIESITVANQRQKNIILSFIVISILGSLLILLIWNRFLLKKRTNEMLEIQMQIIEETNEKLRQSESDLKLLNSTKDKFFSIIAHDLKNPIGAILGITELLTKDFDTHSVDALREYNSLIHDSSKQLFELLQNLLQWAQSQTGKIEYKPQIISLNELLKDNINLLKLTAQNKNIKINYRLEQEDVYADKEMLNTVIRNLISNAVKFTHTGGNVNVSSISIDNRVEVSVKDSGVGMTKDELRKLFRLDVYHTTMGTLNETGTGLGLILCKEFIEKNKGKIWVESEPGKGSCFIFTLPKSKMTDTGD